MRSTWTNAQLIPLKLCIASAYLLVGAYFHDFFRKYYVLFIVLFVITVIPSLYLWITKLRKENNQSK
ncbi:MAG TPA: hypothetical protein VGG71_10950 [Chitinophagaceae bacterium]